MSFHHENIIWQTEDGKWSIGFYTRLRGDAYGTEDYDPEWDDDFDFDTFQWASTGHPSMDDASRAWRGPNPGTCSVLHLGKDPAKAQRLDAMVAAYRKR